MKNLIALIISATVWYGITSLVAWNLNISEWHWMARIFWISFTLLTYERVKNNK